MDDNISRILVAVNRLLETVEFDEDRAMLYIQMPGTEYGFEMDEKILNPTADALVRLQAEVDALEMVRNHAISPEGIAEMFAKVEEQKKHKGIHGHDLFEI